MLSICFIEVTKHVPKIPFGFVDFHHAAFMSPPAFAADDRVSSGAKGHWSDAAIQNAVKNGLLDGVRISPDAPITRCDFADMVVRAYGAYTKADLSGYSDIAAGTREEEVMAKAVQMKAFKGEGGKLYPNRLITREEACLVLARLLWVGAPDGFSLNEFSDSERRCPGQRVEFGRFHPILLGAAKQRTSGFRNERRGHYDTLL